MRAASVLGLALSLVVLGGLLPIPAAAAPPPPRVSPGPLPSRPPDSPAPPGPDRSADDREALRESLLEAARLGGSYLLRSLQADGRFRYRYRPESDEIPGGYNILRHAGTIYSLLELHQASGDPTPLAVARRALAHLRASIQPWGRGRGRPRLAVVEDGVQKLGGDGLGLLALAHHAALTGRRGDLERMRGLARGILAVQRRDGTFWPHKRSYPRGRAENFRSAFYPGEACLGLVRLYEVDPDPRWLEGARRGVRGVLRRSRKQGDPTQAPLDHWLLYAMERLSRHVAPGSPESEELREGARFLLALDRHPFPWSPCPTGNEGLAAAARLLARLGDERGAARCVSELLVGVRAMLRRQIGAEEARSLPRPDRSLGGFLSGRRVPEVRIDDVQHNLSGILALRALLGETQAADTQE